MKFSGDEVLQTAAGASLYVLITMQACGVVRNCRRVDAGRVDLSTSCRVDWVCLVRRSQSELL